jgi:hypothetical protein
MAANLDSGDATDWRQIAAKRMVVNLNPPTQLTEMRSPQDY